MTSPVTVTDSAARRISQIASGDPATPLLRVSVEGGGCSGFQYKFNLVASSLGFMDGAEIDFVDDLMGASFKIKNPVATASCGCGTSFTI
jgi:Fe-S cluster assembly iron-binding protein IscA